MRKIFTLSTCSTSKRILKETGVLNGNFEIQDIKKQAISKEDLEHLHRFTNSYESLFNRRSQKYKALGMKNMSLNENEIKNYILSDYTFLKRPIIIDGDHLFIGNSKKTVEHLKKYFEKLNQKN